MHHGKTSQSRNFQVRSSLFLNNTAVKGGAIMLHHHINASIENCTFLQNLAFIGAAVYAFMNATLQVDSSVFSHSNGIGQTDTVPDLNEDVVPRGGTICHA